MNAWVTRIILDGTDTMIFGLLECMQHPAGIITKHENSTNSSRQVFDILRPRNISIVKSKRWAEDVAARMSSFGINAAAAPQWKGEDV